MTAYTLKRNASIKSSMQIRALFQRSEKIYGKYVTVFYTSSEQEKFAVLVKKSSGSAVERNTIKRWIREIYRVKKVDLISDSFEIMIMTDRKIQEISFRKLSEDIKEIFIKIDKRTNGSDN